MNCPKCIGKLEEKIIENTKVDVCWVCEGIWFDFGELEKVVKKDSTNFKTIDVDRQEIDGKESKKLHEELDAKTGKCPKCTEAINLDKISYPNNVLIDTCPKCKGIWLDGGEIHKLRDRSLVKLMDGLYSFKEGFLDILKSTFRGNKRRRI